MSDAKSPPPAAAAGNDAVAIARGIGGAFLGAAAGVLVFVLIMYFEIPVYPVAAIGALTGIGCSLLSRRRSLLLGVICLAVAIVTTFFNEWINNPFDRDASFGFFVRHIKDAQLMWVSLLLGGGLSILVRPGEIMFAGEPPSAVARNQDQGQPLAVHGW